MGEFASCSDAANFLASPMEILKRQRVMMPGEILPPESPVWGSGPVLPVLPVLSARPARSLAARLADLYGANAAQPTAAEISALKLWIEIEFENLPCPVDFHYLEIDLSLANRIYENSGVLAISVLNNTHPFLSFRENAKFRAIHDWHHISRKIDSSLSGEIQTYKIARKSAPRSIWWLLHSEIILQAAACIHFGEFQAQKFVNAIGAAK
jgi:hypothetical protein